MRVESQVRVPVEQAQLIDASAFRFDTSVAQAVGDTGKVIGELSRRKQGMEDRIAISNSNAAMKKAQLDYQTEIIGKPLDQHAGILQKHINIAKSTSLSQKMSKEARTTTGSSLAAWGQGLTDSGKLATIMALHKEDRIRVTADLEEALVEGDEIEIQAAEEAFDEHYATDPEAGKVTKDRLEVRATKATHDNAIAAAEETAARFPQATIARVEEEQKNRAEGKEKDFPLLSSKDLEQVRDYAKTIGEKKKDESARLSNETVTTNYTAIANGEVDITKMINDINANPAMSGSDKAKAIEKTRTFFSGWHSTKMANKKWPLVDDDEILQNLNTTLTEQSSGSIDINETNEIINKAANEGKITKETRDSLRAKARKGGNDAIDKSVQQFTSRVRNALTGRFTDRVARAKVREAAVGLEGLSRSEKNEIQTANYLLSVSYDQLHRYSADLDSALREVKGGRETISGIEATAIAASVWEKYKTKTTTQRINEFQEFTGQRVPQPNGFSNTIWRRATSKQRSQIVAAMERGMTAKQVKKMVSK
jgi:hypothetical protein